jgi:hypothetical protein
MELQKQLKYRQTKSDNTSHQKDYTGGSKVATGGQKQTV